MPSAGSISLCPPDFTADRIGNPGLARLASDGIVAAFAIRVADRMNRREINDVETHRLRVIDPRQAIAKSRAAIAATLGRAREKFIPGGRSRLRSIDDHARRRRVLRRAGAIRISRHQHLELAGMRDRVDLSVGRPCGSVSANSRKRAASAGSPRSLAAASSKAAPSSVSLRSVSRCRLRISR